MTDTRERKIDETVERLIAEQNDKTRNFIFCAHCEEHNVEYKLLRRHSTPIILQAILSEFKRSPLESIVPRDYVFRTILKPFIWTHGWSGDLEYVIRENNNRLWVNAIAFARKELVENKPQILIESKAVPENGFQLNTGAADHARRHLAKVEAQAVRAEKERAGGAPKPKWISDGPVVEDALYIMNDPKRPVSCKIGAGKGDCKAREEEARLTTDSEAKIVHVQPIGCGLAKRALDSALFRLGRTYQVKDGWVDCKWSMAVPVLEALGKDAQRLFPT